MHTPSPVVGNLYKQVAKLERQISELSNARWKLEFENHELRTYRDAHILHVQKESNTIDDISALNATCLYVAKRIEQIAFSMRAPNVSTPQFMQLALWLRGQINVRSRSNSATQSQDENR